MAAPLTPHAARLIAAGLTHDTPDAPLLTGVWDDRVTWNRKDPATAILEPVFETLAITALICMTPAPPYDRILSFLADEALRLGRPIQPRDCETRTFFHDLPVTDMFGDGAISIKLRHRSCVVVTGPNRDADPKNPGIRLIATGTFSPDQAFIAISSACFAAFVTFFSDYLTALRSASATPAMHRTYDAILPALSQPFAPPPRLMTGPFATEDAVYAALLEAGRTTVAFRLVDSCFGNVSCTFRERMYISQTGSLLDELAGCIDPVPLDGSETTGLTASSELSAHLDTQARTGCRAILHGHPKFCVILSMDCDPQIRAACPHKAVCHTHCPRPRSLMHVPIVTGEVGNGPRGLCHTLPEAFGTADAVMVHGHGLFAIGHTDFTDAFETLLNLEIQCRNHYRDLVRMLRYGTGVPGKDCP